jgi:hypothetical protein
MLMLMVPHMEPARNSRIRHWKYPAAFIPSAKLKWGDSNLPIFEGLVVVVVVVGRGGGDFERRWKLGGFPRDQLNWICEKPPGGARTRTLLRFILAIASARSISATSNAAWAANQAHPAAAHMTATQSFHRPAHTRRVCARVAPAPRILEHDDMGPTNVPTTDAPPSEP